MGPHFSEQAFDFLEELEHRNNREWFEEHKGVYETELKARMLEVIEAINTRLGEFAPDYLRPAPKAMLRIYRDVRFSNDKTPYKTHLAANWPRQGLEKTGGAGFFLQVGVHGVMVAAGAYSPGSPQLHSIREYLLDHHDEVRTLLAEESLVRLAEPLDGHPLIRGPKGFPVEHPAADLLRVRSWALFGRMPGDAALADDFVDAVVERFRALAPLVDFLNVPLAAVTPLEREAAAGRRRA
ncbi:DUF2461 domain-containing protein [Cryobacterium sp. SO2]|uniref:DUF2461 domain-containing protein n=1 Tax=Cryobacterium sp. SO2 TaxID=1897060 RepID=UPI00223D87A6|nr:DUF2461 domain-containing protein [Cryobacterium sp. SO2]WEO78488.1 DUF2461 domain-containing protein [Cryobacterium sp. SO2]